MRSAVDICLREVTALDRFVWIVVYAVSLLLAPQAAAIDTIDTDTTINDATHTMGISVVAGTGPTTTTVSIESGAQIGTDTIPDPESAGTFPNISVVAFDDSIVNFTGGAVDGRVMMRDTSYAEVSGVTLPDGLATYGSATATVSGVAQILGTVFSFDDSFIDLNNSSFSSAAISAFDQSQIEYDGGTMTVDSAINSYATTTIDMDGVDINGNSALASQDASVITYSNATIMGDDAVVTFGSPVGASTINLNNVNIVGDTAIRVFGGGGFAGTVNFIGGSIEGDDPLQPSTPSNLNVRDVTITDTGGGTVDATLRTFSESETSLRNVHIDGGGITMFGGTVSLDDVTFESTTELLELFTSSEGTVMTILGQSFLVDGVPTDPGTLSTAGTEPLTGELIVTLRSGETMQADFSIGGGTTSTAAIILVHVPEPGSALLACAALIWLPAFGWRRARR